MLHLSEAFCRCYTLATIICFHILSILLHIYFSVPFIPYTDNFYYNIVLLCITIYLFL